MIGTVIGEKEEQPVSALSWTGILSVASETARRITLQPSFWFALAMLAGVSSVALAAWEGGALHDGCLVYGRY
jgi:hypothetical protein